MKTLTDVQQGSQQWHIARTSHFCASEAPAMLGVSKFTTRSDLLKQKSTGIAPDVDPAKQRLFSAGHQAEAMARPIAEGIIGADLYPIVATRKVDGLPLLASFDGLTMDESIVWETKLWNESLAQACAAGDLEPHYWAQLEHQLIVSGAEKVLFTTSDGTPERTVSTWYHSVPERREQVLKGWAQFAEDLADYTPTEAKVKPIGRTPETLPALHIEVTGMVTASNLAEYKAHAMAVFAGINRELVTDQDFASAEATVKWCSDIEQRLAAAKQHALSQTASIDDLFRTIDAISAEARATRLDLDKLVKARKDTIRAESVLDGRNAMIDHIEALNKLIGRRLMPAIACDFAGAIKGKRSIDSMNDAISTELARAKINANEWADKITLNLRAIEEHKDYGFLFADLDTLVLKDPELVTVGIKYRIAEHQAKEAARIEAVRASAEAIAKAQAEASLSATVDKADTPVTHVEQAQPAINFALNPGEKDNELEPPTLRLGVICERLGFNITANFLASLGFDPVAADKRALLYRDSDFPKICAALVRHINSVAMGVAA